ncbi:hypothetical protein EDD29_2136 [Actinocorallia herbida]|uniref:Neocarzinostatin family protein n=1 Tax=Actinocorallia herbida TaxID=58109 RepID=A0A3N1CTG8_9ACTN|nr:hypothetical protein [Actinocorallia herbida]ROO84609.1 hypothetical protein EDD29_2136 [Actinocorallia herbida]
MRAGAALFFLAATAAAFPGAAVQAAPGDGVLVVHTTFTTADPTRGEDVHGQVWVAATGGAATNATLTFSATPNTGVGLEAVCTRTAQGYCKLGDVDAAGTSIPFTLRVKAGASRLTVTVGAFARADGSESVGEYTKVAFARTPPKTQSPEATPTTASPTPTASATTTAPSVPAAVPAPGTTVLVPPVTTPGATDPGAGLPQVAPTPSAALPGYAVPSSTEEALPATELTGANDVSPLLALGQSVWLGVLLAACTLASAAAIRRGARIRHAAPTSGPRRRKP